MSDLGKQRTLSAILFADIQGYTAIMQSDEAQAIAYLNHYQSSLLAAVNKYKGEVIKNYGDGSLCLFSSVLDAVQCAQSLQLSLKEDPAVPLRIGLHLGDVMLAGNDIYGDSINIAARIESMGVAGNVLLSRSVYDRVKNQHQIKMQSLGKFDFKNIEEPIEVFALANEGMVIPEISELKGKFKETNNGILKSKSTLWALLSLALLTMVGGWYFFDQLAGSNGSQLSSMEEEALNDEESIAVLPFADMSASQDQVYFSEGISEEILNLLTKIKDLKVISRTSSFAFKGKETTTKEIGELLNVNHLLDGSIRKSGKTFRIAAQLIEAKTGTQLWSETYDRSMDDIFKIQDEIASQIIDQLEVSLMGKSIESKTVNVDAYNLFLEAKLLRDQRNFESDSIAEQLIKESIALDSTYAPAWALLCEVVYNGAFSYSRYSIAEAMPLCFVAAKKSIALDPNSALGYIALTTLNRAENDFEAADENLKKAMEIDSENNTDVIYESASYALDLGNLNEAINQLKKAIRLDPINYLLYYTLGLHLMWVEDYPAAEKAMAKYLRVNPNSGLANNFMAQIYFAQGETDKAFAALKKDTDPFWSLYRKCILEFAVGNKAQADRDLAEFIKKFGDEGWPNIAHVYAVRGEKDQAFKWLELSVKNEDASLFEILNYPEFKVLHKDPRWNKFIGSLGLPSKEGFSK